MPPLGAQNNMQLWPRFKNFSDFTFLTNIPPQKCKSGSLSTNEANYTKFLSNSVPVSHHVKEATFSHLPLTLPYNTSFTHHSQINSFKTRSNILSILRSTSGWKDCIYTFGCFAFLIFVSFSSGIYIAYKMNEWCFRPRFLTCKAILGWEQPLLMRWIFVMNHDPGAGSFAGPVDQKSNTLPLPRMPLYVVYNCW